MAIALERQPLNPWENSLLECTSSAVANPLAEDLALIKKGRAYDELTTRTTVAVRRPSREPGWRSRAAGREPGHRRALGTEAGCLRGFCEAVSSNRVAASLARSTLALAGSGLPTAAIGFPSANAPETAITPTTSPVSDVS